MYSSGGHWILFSPRSAQQLHPEQKSQSVQRILWSPQLASAMVKYSFVTPRMHHHGAVDVKVAVLVVVDDVVVDDVVVDDDVVVVVFVVVRVVVFVVVDVVMVVLVVENVVVRVVLVPVMVVVLLDVDEVVELLVVLVVVVWSVVASKSFGLASSGGRERQPRKSKMTNAFETPVIKIALYDKRSQHQPFCILTDT